MRVSSAALIFLSILGILLVTTGIVAIRFSNYTEDLVVAILIIFEGLFIVVLGIVRKKRKSTPLG